MFPFFREREVRTAKVDMVYFSQDNFVQAL